MGTRVVVGFVLAVLAIVLIVYGGLWYFGMMALFALIGLTEFYQLLRRYRPLPLAGFLGLALMLCTAWFRGPDLMTASIAAGLLLTFALACIPGPRRGVSVRISVTMLGVFYVGVGFAHLLLLRKVGGTLKMEGISAGDYVFALAVVLGTWAGDTVAYFTGRYFGATPMAPRLSPKKTWEGFIGGFIGTVLMVVFIGIYRPSVGVFHWLLLGLTIAAVGPLGDLFESLLKRDVAIKDAGRFFPGHGGVLDRFDALIFAAVASYYLVVLVF